MIDDSNKKACIDAMREYMYFVLDNQPDNPADTEKFERKRTALHKKVTEAFGLRYDDDRHTTDLFGWHIYSLDEFRKLFPDIEMYLETKYYSIKDNLANRRSPIQICYSVKTRIDSVIANLEKKYLEPAKKFRKFIDQYYKDWNAYCKDKKDYDRCPAKCNGHEFNRAWGSFEGCFHVLREFAKYPREAYLKPAVDVYYTKQMDRIAEEFMVLDYIYMKTVPEYSNAPFYKYTERKNENKEKTDGKES